MLSPGTPVPQTDLADAAVSAHDYGRRIFLMLQAATMPDDQKAAWVELVPTLNLEQLERLSKLLEGNLTAQIAEEFEDVLLKAKAAMAKRDLSLAAVDLQTEHELAALEQELTQSENV